MSLPTNEEVYNAIARVLACRDSRRGRKPALIVTIITDENGKTVVTDHNTGCVALIGKRKYKKRAFTAPTKAAVPSVKRTVTKAAINKTELSDGNIFSGVRISPVTGKPVRSYKKRETSHTVHVVDTNGERSIQTIVPPITYKDKMTQELAELKVSLTQTKLSRDACNDEKKIKVFDRVITGLTKRAEELEIVIAAQK